MQADKGNATVIMDKSDYEKKATDILEKPPFVQLVRDPHHGMRNE